MEYCFSGLARHDLKKRRIRSCFVFGLLLATVNFVSSEQVQAQTHKEKQHHQHQKGKKAKHHISTTNLLPPSAPAQTQAVGGAGVAPVAGAVVGAGAVGAATATTPSPQGGSPVVSAAAVPAEAEKGSVTGMPIPRFASLRADEVNMRSGPGTRYPVIWTYYRRHMPVKILREFDVWRLVEDVDGQKGWIQLAILSGGRSFIITGAPLSTADEASNKQNKDKDKKKNEHMDSRIVGYMANTQSIESGPATVIVRDAPQESANPVAVLKPGVVGTIKECPSGSEWCKVTIKSYTGWIPRNRLWGILPQENIEAH
ncbi:SH3 domain-containing protein [Commensalibacter oyaizuii]|uniref:SH3 domain-containing protein n=1 Tax=Commensalibacter oyaizuii TaxID=3043873 RepID=A0ABT6Q1R0_9PROT|nr:SH3 domain-containing protein [Commensalibacter sp. TBRC 16381]MDI2091054.1 SH3 domain-containing protein [Commensalibacter sp. TBRC 16381]